MYSSFISEHTAQYILVPRIVDILRSEWSKVAPIYFWAGREGNRSSDEIHRQTSTRVLAMYPHREVIWQALVNAMLEVGITDATEKVTYSQIPLRG